MKPPSATALSLPRGDKIKPTQLEATSAAILTEIRKRPGAYPQVLATAAETGEGIAELRAAVLDSVEN